MTTINEARLALKADLSTVPNVSVFDYLPESMVAPAYVIFPDSPFVDSEGVPFGSVRIRFRIIAVADVTTNEYATQGLDNLITLALSAVDVESVDEPYVYQSNTALHLAADIHVSDVIRI